MSLALIVADHRTDALEPVRGVLLSLVYPFQVIVNTPLQAARGLLDDFALHRTLTEEVRALQAQQLVLKVQLQKFNALESENRHLRELMDSSFRVGDRLLVAELLAVDSNPFSRHITIDKGALHDVYEGQPLLDEDGVVGQIVHVSPLSSTAILVTDPGHGLPVQFTRSGLRALVVGSGTKNRLEVPFLAHSEDVRQGDLVVTSGLGGHFPAGYPVGRVLEVVQDPHEPFANVALEPTAHPERSSQFLLVWPGREVVPEVDAVADTDSVPTEAVTDARAAGVNSDAGAGIDAATPLTDPPSPQGARGEAH